MPTSSDYPAHPSALRRLQQKFAESRRRILRTAADQAVPEKPEPTPGNTGSKPSY